MEFQTLQVGPEAMPTLVLQQDIIYHLVILSIGSILTQIKEEIVKHLHYKEKVGIDTQRGLANKIHRTPWIYTQRILSALSPQTRGKGGGKSLYLKT